MRRLGYTRYEADEEQGFLDRRTESVTEKGLVEGCRRRDRHAQRALFEQTSARIVRLLHRMTGNQDDASDLAQETYFKAFDRIEEFDGRSSITTWLYRIAVNEALQFLRRGRTTRRILGELTPSVAAPCPEEATAVRMDVRAALAAVDPPDRAILLLRYEEGLDYRAIAEVIGCANGTVASRLSRARDRLREILRESYGCREETDAGVHPKSSP